MLTQEWNLEKAIAFERRDAQVERAMEIARYLKASGMGIDEIAKATKLTVDDILRL